MAVHRIEGENGEPDVWCISSYQVWRPGAYESEKAARYAFRFDDEVLTRLQESVNPGGVITYEMLKRARDHQRAGEGQ